MKTTYLLSVILVLAFHVSAQSFSPETDKQGAELDNYSSGLNYSAADFRNGYELSLSSFFATGGIKIVTAALILLGIICWVLFFANITESIINDGSSADLPANFI